MNRTMGILLLALAGSASGQLGRGVAPDSLRHPPLANSESEKRILDTINQAVKSGDLYANVPASDGRMLRVLAEAVNAKHIVEIGTSTGISGMWFAMALQKTGGTLTTFELDHRRATVARANFQKAGVENLVTVVEGDAHQNITRVTGPIDIVFIDAEKSGYVDYFNKMLPKVRPGGLILAHNVDMVPDYVTKVSGNPEVDTVYYMQGNQLAITLKKR